jgi:hypothetical protein
MLPPRPGRVTQSGERHVENQPSMGALGPIFWICFLAFLVFMIASMWKVFTKAGKPGWACIIPIYNVVVLLDIVGKPLWWIILYIIPFVGFIIALIVTWNVAKVFGKGGGFALGLIFLPFIFFPILGFGDARYTKPAAA